MLQEDRRKASGGRAALRPGKAAALCALLALCAGTASASPGHDPKGHRMVVPSDLKWSDVPSLPKGAKMAVVEGPLNEAVPFTVRLKFSANYRIPPHWHPAVERVTVLSGTFNMGTGERFDARQTSSLAAGSIAIMQPKTSHFAWTEGETLVQLHGTGPWGITYIDPADDPRQN